MKIRTTMYNVKHRTYYGKGNVTTKSCDIHIDFDANDEIKLNIDANYPKEKLLDALSRLHDYIKHEFEPSNEV
jgi:hypothetical protein